MDSLAFQENNSFEEDNQIIRDSLNAIGQRYSVSKVTDAEEEIIQDQLAKFDSFSGFEKVVLYGVAKITQNQKTSYFIVVTLNAQAGGLTAYQDQQPGSTEFVFVGLTELDKDYGHVFIRPETMTDKLIELFNPTKIRFEGYSEFSKQYHVTADEPGKVKEHFSGDMIDAIQSFEGLQIEIQGHYLMVRLPKGFRVEVAESIADFLVALSH